jgi:SAM-dependent methyltransferase
MSDRAERPHDRESWNLRYVEGETPWDSGEPDSHLARVVEAHGICPGKALEIGCGTGTNSIWLAKQGFSMTGVDQSELAVAKAKSKSAEAGVEGRFVVLDFLAEPAPDPPFEFVYDRGCFHVFPTADERSRFASRIGDLLEPDGIWHSLIGSTDGPPRDTGPPRLSALDVVSAVEPRFEILELSTTTFDGDRHERARAWVLVARRREGGAS